MKLGVCTGSENFKIARKLGYAYWEFSLAAIAAMNDEEFRDLQKRQKLSLRPVYSCNGMLPGSVPCVGPDASDTAILEYLHHALTRAQKLGVKTVVFGSGASRRVPEGWTHEQAWRQLIHFLMLAGNTAEKYGITIAIEPLRRQECNIINYVSEATALASIVNLPNVGVLGDTFHMNAVGEPYEALAQAGSLLKHVHISHSPERTYPCSDDGEDYAELFKVLKSIGYEGGISIEAGTSNFESDGAAAFACRYVTIADLINDPLLLGAVILLGLQFLVGQLGDKRILVLEALQTKLKALLECLECDLSQGSTIL